MGRYLPAGRASMNYVWDFINAMPVGLRGWLEFSVGSIAFWLSISATVYHWRSSSTLWIAALYLGRLIVCLFVPADKQEDRLADFEEMLNTVWIPQFGRRIGRLVYIWQALRSASAILKIGAVTAVADRIARSFGW